MKTNELRQMIREEITRLNEATGYDVELFWKGLFGKESKIGRFVISKSDYDKLERILGHAITFDLYDDKGTVSKLVSFADVMKAIKSTSYGKIAFKEGRLKEWQPTGGKSLPSSEKAKIINIMKANKFLDLRKPLTAAGFKVDYTHAPGGMVCYASKKGFIPVIIGSAKLFEPGEVEFEHNGIVMGDSE